MGQQMLQTLIRVKDDNIMQNQAYIHTHHTLETYHKGTGNTEYNPLPFLRICLLLFLCHL